jgi:hypothetical protein
MSLVLRIESGSHAGKVLPIGNGETLRVGRTERADYAVPDDTFLSGVHFELRSDGSTCTLLDLNSSNGTTIRGARISQARLVPGDRFTAGRTDFLIVAEAAPPVAAPITPAAAAAEPAKPLGAKGKERLLKEMRTNLQPLYAVLDAAHDSKILAVLSKYKCEYISLFDIEKAPELVRFAPYIVALPAASPAIEPLVDLGWGNDWGIYLTSTASGGELIQFLRRLLISTQPDGQEVLLRFYDPRVLRTLLSHAAPQQWSYFFGPVRSYLVADGKPQIAIGFAVTQQGLERHDIYLTGEKPTEVTAVTVAGTSAATPPYRLLLSEQQTDKLAAQEHDPFPDELYAEMQEKYPERFAPPADAEMREWIAYGCERPKRYGIQTEQGIRDYVSLMMQLGRDFDVDPALLWASDLLGRRLAPAEKLAQLKVEASKFLARSTF